MPILVSLHIVQGLGNSPRRLAAQLWFEKGRLLCFFPVVPNRDSGSVANARGSQRIRLSRTPLKPPVKSWGSGKWDRMCEKSKRLYPFHGCTSKRPAIPTSRHAGIWTLGQIKLMVMISLAERQVEGVAEVVSPQMRRLPIICPFHS